MNDLVLLEPDDDELVALFAGEVSPPLRVQEQLVLLALQPHRLAQPAGVQRCRVQVKQALPTPEMEFLNPAFLVEVSGHKNAGLLRLEYLSIFYPHLVSIF
jgi:hypothetical protein